MKNKKSENADLKPYRMYGLTLLQFMGGLAALGIVLAILIR
jgi:hypothetical protein